MTHPLGPSQGAQGRGSSPHFPAANEAFDVAAGHGVATARFATSPAIDALRCGAARAERFYIVGATERRTHALPAMVALNVLRELDLLFIYAINELAARRRLATCPLTAPPRIKLLVLSSVCPTSAGERDRYRENAVWRGRLDRRAFPASAPSSCAIGTDLIDEIMSAAVAWHVLIAKKLGDFGRKDQGTRKPLMFHGDDPYR